MAAAPVQKRPSRRTIITMIIIVLVAAFPVTFLLRAVSTEGPSPSVRISGTAITTGYGTSTSVYFMKQNSSSGPDFFAMVVNGTYSISVQNDADYVGYVDFQPPSGASGTCGGFVVDVDSGTGNSSLTYDFSCVNPHTFSFP